MPENHSDSTRPFTTTASGWGVSSRKPELIKITDRVYSGHGYSVSNIFYVITNKSVVVINTGGSQNAARACFDEFRRICQLPASYIIYTCFHGDHVRGAKVFHTPTTKIIAQKRITEELAKASLLLPYTRRLNALQRGIVLQEGEQGIALEEQFDNSYLPPDITFDDEYRFEEGGVDFVLSHTQGETVDHLMVWLPQDKVLFPGDLFYPSFPMLSNPMKPDRPVLAWAESLERMRVLYPRYLVPSHGRPLQEADDIDGVLDNYAKAVRYVHEETVRLINEGRTLEEIRQHVQLPDELAQLPYLQQGYGKVAWAVNGIFRQYTGWYSLNPTDLNPSPRAVLSQAILEACGSPAPLLRRARQALQEGDNQLVLELTEVVLQAEPQHQPATMLRVRALRRLGAGARNGVEQNLYRVAAQMLSE